MSSYLQQLNSTRHSPEATPLTAAAQQGSADAIAFELWVSRQATTLAKLKIFSSMAKSVNDQQ